MGKSVTIGSATIMLGDCRDAVPSVYDAVVFDPEWDAVDKSLARRMINNRCCIAFGDGQRVGDIIDAVGQSPTWIFTWDCVASWFVPGLPLRRSKHCVWFGDISDYDNRAYIRPRDPREKQRYVTNSRGTYLFDPDELGVRMTDIYQLSITQYAAERIHPHEKPYEWCRCLLLNCIGRDRIVFDPYMGSGVFAQICIEENIQYIGVEINVETYESTVAYLEEINGTT